MVQNPLMLLLMALVVSCRVADADVTCQASSTFEETSVTCNFGKDLSVSSHNFNVQFFYPNHQADPPESVLMCNWKTSSELQCKKARDVRFDKNVTDRVTFHRDQSVRKAGGKYVCQVVPSFGDDVVPCMLVFKGDLPSFTRPTTTTTTQSLLLGEIRSLSEMTLVVSIVALVVVFILLILFLIYCCRRRIAEKVPVLAKVLGQGRDEKETHNVEEGKAVKVDDHTDDGEKTKKGVFEEDYPANDGHGKKPKKLFWPPFDPSAIRIAPLKSTTSEIITDCTKQMEKWADYYQELYSRETIVKDTADKENKQRLRSSSSQKEGKQKQEELPMMPPDKNEKGKNRSDPARQEPAASGIGAATMPLEGENRSDRERPQSAALRLDGALLQPAMSSRQGPDDVSAENKPESKKEREAREKKEKKEREKKEKEEKERKMREEKERKKTEEKERKKRDSKQ